MAIDMHAHWVPRRLMSESQAGRDWYGWRILQDGADREYASLGQHMLLFSASQGTLDDPMGRAKRREAEDGITFEALMLTGLFWNYHLPEDAAVRACREVNEEVAEVQRAYPDRFCGMALLPMQHQKAALAELEYATGKLNLRTIAIASNVRNLNLDEPSVLPVIEEAAKMGCRYASTRRSGIRPRMLVCRATALRIRSAPRWSQALQRCRWSTAVCSTAIRTCASCSLRGAAGSISELAGSINAIIRVPMAIP
jgi:hypothetical protein